MNSLVLLIICIAVLAAGYIFYGGWLCRQWGVGESKEETPAHTMEDGIDYVPAKAPVLMGHHFSSIAGAGPITGPINAALFGWLPVTLWILVGGIFFGGVHDFGALFASIRHKGQSVGEIISANMSRRAKRLFLIFAYLTLLLVVAAFASIVASTFGVKLTEAGAIDYAASASNASVAMVSLLFILIAIVFGFCVYRRNAPMSVASVIGVLAIVLIMAIGMNFHPIYLTNDQWMIIVGIYIAIASVTPVWILLQPRDYLSSFLLYAMLIIAVVGVVGAHPAIEADLFPAFAGFSVTNESTGVTSYLFPVLFTTVACGAISGFHSLVSSGTTSKQLDRCHAHRLRRHAPGVCAGSSDSVCHRLCKEDRDDGRSHGYLCRRHRRHGGGDPGTEGDAEHPVYAAGSYIFCILSHLTGYRDPSGTVHVPGVLAGAGTDREGYRQRH